MKGETGASTSGDWLDNSFGESVIKLDNERNCLSTTTTKKTFQIKSFSYRLNDEIYLNGRPNAVRSPAIGLSADSKC